MPIDRLNGAAVPEKFRTRKTQISAPKKTPLSDVFFSKKVFSFVGYAEKDVPHPQPPVAFGFSNVKPDPIMFDV
jgi:hypothetical protein